MRPDDTDPDGAILAWLSSLQHNEIRDDLLRKRLPDTGNWILDSPKLKEWTAGCSESPILWCYGLSGIGKSTLSAIITEHLENELCGPDEALAYIFTIYDSDVAILEILSSICRQLAARCSQLPWQLVKMYKQMSQEGTRPDIDELMLLIISMCDSFSRVFIVVDDIAELSRGSDRAILIPKLQWLRNHGARIFVASTTDGDRPERWGCAEDIEEAFENETELALKPNLDDMKAYVLHKMKEQEGWEEILSKAGVGLEILDRVVAEASGVYLVAELLIKRELRKLEDNTSPHLSEQPDTGLSPEEFDEFRQTINSLARHSSQRCALVMSILSWLAHAKRPLRALELVHAVLYTAPRGTEFSFHQRDLFIRADSGGKRGYEYPQDTLTVNELCGGLISVSQDETIILSNNHNLSKAQRSDLFPGFDLEIVLKCMETLSQDSVLEGCQYPSSADPENVERLVRDQPLWLYCQEFWTEHVIDCTDTLDMGNLDIVNDSVIDYLNKLAKNPASWVEERKPMFDKAYHVVVTNDETPILKVARLGITRLLETMLLFGSEHDIDKVSNNNETAMSVAVEAGHVSTARLLYQHGASVHHTDRYGCSLLHTAVEKDDEVMVMLLIHCGLMPDLAAGGRYYQTPLYAAASKNSARAGKVLLRYGKKTEGAMKAAAGAGSLTFVKLLVENGCTLQNASGRDARTTPLGEAIRSGSVELVKYMVENGAGVCEQDDIHRTPIHIAAWYPNLEIFKILMAQGADPFALDDGSNDVCEGDCAMSSVIRKESQEVIDYLFPLLHPNVPVASLLEMAVCAARAQRPSLSLFNSLLEKIPGRLVDWRKRCSNSLLGAAVCSDNEDILPSVLSRGIDVNSQDEQNWTCLHLAAHRKKPRAVQLLLEHGANANLRTKYGMAALHVTAYEGDTACCDILLTHGADLEAKAADGSTPLIAAAYGPQRDAVVFLLDHKADIGACNVDGESALHHAVLDNDVGLVQTLLQCGADTNVQALKCGTALHLAAGKGSIEIARQMLIHRADVEQGFDYQGGHFEPPEEYGSEAGVLWNQLGIQRPSRPRENWITVERGWTPLHTATAGNHVGIMELLLDNSAELSSRSATGATPLIIAASSCFPDALKVLLSRGANVKDKTDVGNTPLHAVAEFAIAKRNTELANRFKCGCQMRHEAEEAHEHEDHSRSDCIALLVDHSADIDMENDLGQTPLALAVEAGNEDVVTILVDHTLKRGESFPAAVYNRLLLRCGPDTDANLLRLVTDITTETTESKALWSGIIAQAAPAGNSDLVELALERGGTCPHETSEGINPFLEAIKNEHPDTVKLLLEARASPSQADCRGRNALHLACHIKETKYKSLSVVQGDRSKQLMVQELLQHGAQINARDNDGNTALHFAVVTGDFELVRGLISFGASVNIRNNRGETMLHSAVSTWVFPDIVEHLLHKGACASAQDLEGYTPLHKIRERRGECDRAVELLINHGADVSIRAHNGDLAIHRAVGRGNYTLFLALQRSGAKIHEKGSRGMTALHIAAKKGKVSFIDPLVKAGADVDAVNDRGRTAAYYAGQRGDQELIDELVKHSNLKKGTDSNPFVRLVEQ